MENLVSYHQHCPVCGRGLMIAVTLLGRRVYCQHCGGGFVATPSDAPRAAAETERPRRDRVDELIERAEMLLAGKR
jgi:ribosomal protein S27AE